MFVGLFGIMHFASVAFPPYDSAVLSEQGHVTLLYDQFWAETLPSEGMVASLPERREVYVGASFPKALTKNESRDFHIHIEAKRRSLPSGLARIRVRTQSGIELYDWRGEPQDQIAYEFYADSPHSQMNFNWTVLPRSTGRYRFWIHDLSVPVGLGTSIEFSEGPFENERQLAKGLRVSEAGNLVGETTFEVDVYTPMGISERTWGYLSLLVPAAIALMGLPVLTAYLKKRYKLPD